MASILSETVCPQCHNEHGIHEVDYRLRREYIFCPQCGYEYRFLTLRDRKTRRFKYKNDGYPITRQIERKGNGVYRFQYNDGSGILGALCTPITDSIVQEFNRIMKSPEIACGGSYLTCWNEKLKTVRILYGTP